MCALVGGVVILLIQRLRLLVEGHVAKEPFLAKPWTQAYVFLSRSWLCKKAGVCQSTW